MPTNGGLARPVLASRAAGARSLPAWSPDGGLIAFQQATGGPSRVFLARADGTSSSPPQITNGSVGEQSPDWQPLPRCTKRGTAGNDTLVRTWVATSCAASGATTRSRASGANDILVGGPGNDRLIGSGGSDVVDGGPGTDTALYPRTAPVTANLTSGFARSVAQGS
jgi:Ca2+-binding RTX toxin-like protein